MLRKLPLGMVITCVLVVAARAQQPSPAQPGPPPSPPSSTTTPPSEKPAANPAAVGMDQPVITLKGGCQPIASLQPVKDCVTTVTREQFEKTTNALQPNMPADAKRNFAMNYGRLLVFYGVAQALHLENDPTMQLIIQFVSKQVLAEGVKRHYLAEYAHPSEQQIEAYYKQNSAKYKEATLQRIIVPRKQADENKPKPGDADEATAAEKLRQRWAAGEDPSKLQQEAYARAGVNGAVSPDVSMGPSRPGSLPVSQESVFQLKAGEVSPVFTEQGVSFIYKVVSVREIPLSEEKEAIIKALQEQQLQDKLQEISRSATPELNEQYFGPAPAAPNVMPRPGAGAPAQPTNPPQ